MKKTLFFLFIFISANAQNKRTINLEIAGTLFSKINTEINNISDITLSTFLYQPYNHTANSKQ